MYMSKIDIKVIIKSNNEISEENYKALKLAKKIEYLEKEFKTSLIFTDNLKIIRENADYLLKLEFIPNKETCGLVFLKKEKENIELKILTDYVIVEKKVIIIKYKILTTNQNVIFKMEM